jgi:NAD(P)-dependent dehydrogenase (short-subunit alcohol dehydrogenase family)
MEELVAFTLGRWKKLDVMFSNAGMVGKVAVVREVQDLDMANFDETMKVNARGMALAMKHASKAMIDTGGGGSIVCTSSIAGVVGGATPIEYTASKHAVVGLMRSAAAELGKRGIRVNCVSPAAVVTPLALRFFGDAFGNPTRPEAEIERYNDAVNVLRGHTLLAVDVARAVLFLASDDSAFVSGHNLVVDGAITTTIRGLDQQSHAP